MSDSIRMICPNPDCINKSHVWRKFDVMKDRACKNCGTMLVSVVSNRVKRYDERAKQQIKQFGEL